MAEQEKTWRQRIGKYLAVVAVLGLLWVGSLWVRAWHSSRVNLAAAQAWLAEYPADLPPTPFPGAQLSSLDRSLEDELGALLNHSLTGSRLVDGESLVFSPDERYLAWMGRQSSGTLNWNTVEVWDVEARQVLRRFELEGLYVNATSFSPSGRRLVVAGNIVADTTRRRILVLDLVDETCVFVADTHSDTTAPILTDERTLLVRRGGALYAVDLEQRAMAGRYDRLANYTRSAEGFEMLYSDFQITDLAMLADGKTVVASGVRSEPEALAALGGSRWAHVEHWDLQSGKLLAAWEPFSGSDLRFSMLPAADSLAEVLLVRTQREDRKTGIEVYRLDLASGAVAPLFKTLEWDRKLAQISPLPLVTGAGVLAEEVNADGDGSGHYLEIGAGGKDVRSLGAFGYDSRLFLLSPGGTYAAKFDGFKDYRLLSRATPEDSQRLGNTYTRPPHDRQLSRGGAYLLLSDDDMRTAFSVVPTVGQDPATITEPLPNHVARVRLVRDGANDTLGTEILVQEREVRQSDRHSRIVPGLSGVAYRPHSVIIRDDGTRVAAVQHDGRVLGCDIDGGSPFAIAPATPAESARSLALLPGDAGFLIAAADGSVARSDWQGGTVWRASLAGATAVEIDVATQGTVAVCWTRDTLARVDLATGTVLSQTPVDDGVMLAALSSDGSRLTYLSRSGRLVSEQGGRTVERLWTGDTQQLADRGDRILTLVEAGVDLLDPENLERVDFQLLGRTSLYGDTLRLRVPKDPARLGEAASAGHFLGIKRYPKRRQDEDGLDVRACVMLESLRSGSTFSYAAQSPREAWKTWPTDPAPTDILCTLLNMGRQTRLTRADDPQATGVLMLFSDYQWLFYTPDGRFDGSERVGRHLVRPTTTDGLPTVAPFTMDSPQRVPGLLHATLRLPLPDVPTPMPF